MHGINEKGTAIAKLRDMMGADLKGANLTGLSQCFLRYLGIVSTLHNKIVRDEILPFNKKDL